MSTAEIAASPRYQLRRTLSPWKFDACINEALDFARTYGVGEIMWKIDTEEISHGLPTLDRIRSFLPALRKSREKFAAHHITMAINPWVTQGMRDAGWDLRQTFPDFEWLTDITGIQTKSQACPLGPAWRNWICDAYELYASTGPRVLWLEDDFRVHRHRPVTVACYCDRHLRTFSEKAGRTFTREFLAAEILKPGKPSPIRKLWFDYVGSVMCETAQLIADRVYAKHPAVQLGLMCNEPRVSASECRDWDRLMKALAGHHKTVVARPCMGNYFEHNLRGLYGSREMISSTLKCIRQPVVACSEVENYPYSQYSKSHRITRAQILLSAALRCPCMTLNLYDHVGTPLAADLTWGKLLADTRPMLDQLVATFTPAGVERGVGILSPEDGPQHVHLKPGDKFPSVILPPDPWAANLQSLGLSVTWADSPVIAVSGQTFRTCAATLDEFFSRGVLLDLSALETLIDMVGPDRARQLTGVTLNSTFTRYDRICSIESISDPEFGGPGPDSPSHVGRPGIAAHHASVDHAGLTTHIADLTLDPKARMISQLVDADFNPMLPGFTAFENSLGGRVVVCPYNLNDFEFCWFLNPARQAQLAAIVTWLFRGQRPLFVEGNPYSLPVRTDYSTYSALVVMNLSLDAYPDLKLHLAAPRRPKTIRALQADGRWLPLTTYSWDATTQKLVIDSAAELSSGDLAAFRVDW